MPAKTVSGHVDVEHALFALKPRWAQLVVANGGRLAKKRHALFAVLTDDEVVQLEAAVRAHLKPENTTATR
ncbi:MAG: hypothetical protein ABJE66_24740 [Deltaproteobacteria bacterium]